MRPQPQGTVLLLLLLLQSFNPLIGKGNYSATIHIEYELGALAINGWGITFGTARRDLADCGFVQSPPRCTSEEVQRGGDWAGPQPARSLLAVPNVTAHPSVASVRITVLLHNGPFLCSFNAC